MGSDENPNIRVRKSPIEPTAQEIEQHNASMHLPYRSWCPTCVHGRGKEDGHSKGERQHPDVPMFSSDYCFMSTKETQSENQDIEKSPYLL